MDTNRPTDTTRKKIFSGMALGALGAGVAAGDGAGIAAPGWAGADAALSVGFSLSGGGSFLTGTTVVCFLCI